MLRLTLTSSKDGLLRRSIKKLEKPKPALGILKKLLSILCLTFSSYSSVKHTYHLLARRLPLDSGCKRFSIEDKVFTWLCVFESLPFAKYRQIKVALSGLNAGYCYPCFHCLCIPMRNDIKA